MSDFTQRAEALLARNARQEVEALAEQAATAPEADPLDIVNFSILTRDNRLFRSADRLANAALRRNPNFLEAWYELAFSRLLQGLHWDAAIAVEEILKRQPDYDRALLLQARLAVLVGEPDTARAARRRLRELNSACENLDALEDFETFFSRYSAARALYLCRRLELSQRYIGGDEIVRRARAALARGQGFSLLRLGDGEGAFLRLSDEDEALYPSLYKLNRADRANVWFAGQVDLERSGFNALTREFPALVANADVVGVPYASWIEHEYRIGSITGVSTLVNLLRMWDLPGVDRGQAITFQNVHLDMEQEGQLRALLSSVTSVGVIGCHSKLPQYVNQTFGVHEIEFHKIPGEKLFANVIGADAAEGVHFPDRFHQVMEALNRDLTGRLFLVAGGYLGKYYCDRIKRSGGVAIDVGSIVDLWLGLITRVY